MTDFAAPRLQFPIRGMDLSTLREVERCGGRFYDGGGSEDAMAILKRYGMNLLRLRLWNDPYSESGEPYGAGTCDLPTVMALAGRAKALGIPWMLDLHYSDFWADPGKQTVPKAWAGLDVAGLENAVYGYTGAVLTELKRAGLEPALVSVGNELTNGLLWPLGRRPNFENIARFVSAGIRAVRAASPASAVILHLDNGGNNPLYRDWFDRYFANHGADFEYIGLSYYPFWHGPLEGLQDNLCDLARRYGKDLIVAETSMGFTLEDYGGYEALSPERRQGMAAKASLAEKISWPMTPQGQCDFLRDVLGVIRRVPGGRCRGLIYWEPAWIPVPGSGWATEAAREYIHERGQGGNEWANQALFDYDGNALPALKVLRDFDKENAI